MMKKNEKLPEVAAFEQAFDRSAQRVSSPLSRSQIQQASLSTRSSGRTSGSSPKVRVSGAMAASAWPPSPGQPIRRGSTDPKRAQRWDEEDEDYLEDEEEEWAERASRKHAAPPPAGRSRTSVVLVGIVLFSVALLAAYSMQSHSRRQYVPGTVSGATVSNISYNAGWPLPYAHVQAQQAPVTDVNPTPALHYTSLPLLAVDVLLLAVPFWLLLEAVWQFWDFVLARYGPRRLLPRIVALGLTGLLATLWMVGALAVGVFLGFNAGQVPLYFLPVLAPAVPGFGLAAGISVVLSVPPVLWPLDFGAFLLAFAMPLALLTICLYLVFCLIGRGVRSRFSEPEE